MVLVLLAGVYWYQVTAAVCPVPIHYRIGTIDDSFTLTEAEAKDFVTRAEAIWENPIKRDLFIYDENAKFTVDFIYDERQQMANEEEIFKKELDKKLAENQEIQNIVTSLQADYEKLAAGYKTRVASYESRLKEYNDEVNKYNDRGGAPADVYEALQAKKTSLETEETELNKLQTDLNNLVNKINALSDRGNELIATYNQEVSKYNKEFGFSREFTQGDYHDGQIKIYKFSDSAELITVLGHEFGHALGLGHIEDDSALMYYLLQDVSESPILSADDMATYYATCGTDETLGQKIRQLIREVLSKFIN